MFVVVILFGVDRALIFEIANANFVTGINIILRFKLICYYLF